MRSIGYILCIFWLTACQQSQEAATTTAPATNNQPQSALQHVTVAPETLADWDPQNHLSPQEIADFKYSISRYFEKQPKKTQKQDIFKAEHDQYYREKARDAKLLYYAPQPDGSIYFAITKIAPSMKEKRVATVGKLRQTNGEITHYQEKFRTWKMEVPELEATTAKLFQEYLQGADLQQYETRFTDPEYLIEFPDERNTYDTVQREWVLPHQQ